MDKEAKKILIVEDDPFILEMYRAKLSLMGHQVLIAGDGLAGKQLVEKERPDLVVLDIIMPRMNGFQLLKTIRKKAEFKEIPILILTNLDGKRETKKGLKLGANEYLIKAYFTPTEVVSRIEALLNR